MLRMFRIIVLSLLPIPLMAQISNTPVPVPEINQNIVLTAGFQTCTFPSTTPRNQLMRAISLCLDSSLVVNRTVAQRGMRGQGPMPVTPRWFNGTRRPLIGLPEPRRRSRIVTGEFIVPEADVSVIFVSFGNESVPVQLQNLSGEIKLSFFVGTNGKPEPKTIQVVTSNQPALNETAINMVRAFIFIPAKSKGVAVRQEVEQIIKFTP